MKILLLNPPKKWKDLYVCREEYGVGTIVSDFLPSNIYLTSAYLRGKDREIHSVDADTQKFAMDHYDVVVVWVCILHTFFQDIEWLKAAKEKGKKTVMILNDPHEGLEMEAMRRFDFIDAAIRNWEREITLDMLLESWEKNGDLDFPGIIYRKNGDLFDTGRRPPEAHLFHLKSSAEILSGIPIPNYKLASLVPSRGCPMPHTLCMHRRSAIRRRRIQDVIDELEIISSRIKKIFIIDPAMLDNRKWVEKFCQEILNKKLQISWRSDARIQHCLDIKFLRFLKKAGCSSIMFYTPTLDEEIGKKIGAVTTPEMLKRAVDNIKKAGMIPMPAFEIGLPWDSSETFLKILNFLKDTPLPWVVLRQFRPWRGTPIYEECKKMKLLENELGIDDYVDSSYPLIGTVHLTREEVEMWKRRILRANKLSLKYFYRFFSEGKKLEKEHISKIFNLIVKKDSYRAKKSI
jgi:radical SAM superfamily enzyme YgiQ (UPF0313 family)